MINLTNARLWGLAAVGLAALVAVALVMPACGGGARQPAETAGTAAPADGAANMPPSVVTVETLRANPNEYYQKPVVVTGIVRQMVGPGAFLLAPTTAAPAGESVLVATGNVPPGLTVGTPVRVTGTPRPFDFNTFNAEVGMNWNQAAFTPYNNQPAILATSVEPTPGSAGAMQPGGTPAQRTPATDETGGTAAPGTPGTAPPPQR